MRWSAARLTCTAVLVKTERTWKLWRTFPPLTSISSYKRDISKPNRGQITQRSPPPPASACRPSSQPSLSSLLLLTPAWQLLVTLDSFEARLLWSLWEDQVLEMAAPGQQNTLPQCIRCAQYSSSPGRTTLATTCHWSLSWTDNKSFFLQWLGSDAFWLLFGNPFLEKRESGAHSVS